MSLQGCADNLRAQAGRQIVEEPGQLNLEEETAPCFLHDDQGLLPKRSRPARQKSGASHRQGGSRRIQAEQGGFGRNRPDRGSSDRSGQLGADQSGSGRIAGHGALFSFFWPGKGWSAIARRANRAYLLQQIVFVIADGPLGESAPCPGIVARKKSYKTASLSGGSRCPAPFPRYQGRGAGPTEICAHEYLETP